MKKNILVFVLLASCVVFQGCGSKKDVTVAIEENETAEAQLVKVKNDELIAAKKEKLAIERAEKEKQRRLDLAAKAALSATYTNALGKAVYYKAEIDPMYPGGPAELAKYLKSNLKYPQAAKDNNVVGTVFVDFVVEENGSVREVYATDLVGEDVDISLKEEAVRVVAAMPAWKAGTQHGKPVDVAYSIPITFELD